jgi:hypothetical protein
VAQLTEMAVFGQDGGGAVTLHPPPPLEVVAMAIVALVTDEYAARQCIASPQEISKVPGPTARLAEEAVQVRPPSEVRNDVIPSVEGC